MTIFTLKLQLWKDTRTDGKTIKGKNIQVRKLNWKTFWNCSEECDASKELRQTIWHAARKETDAKCTHLSLRDSSDPSDWNERLNGRFVVSAKQGAFGRAVIFQKTNSIDNKIWQPQKEIVYWFWPTHRLQFNLTYESIKMFKILHRCTIFLFFQ